MTHVSHADTVRAILYFIGQGHSPEQILAEDPDIDADDIRAAAMEGLRALEEERVPGRPETREERIARVRQKHPHAFLPWSPNEDAELIEEFKHGATVAALSRAFGRPSGGIRMRLDKLGIDPRRGKETD
ncbi:MAG: DUF433 domain-containing protein [Candidatus Thermoplasmatota archaeon]